MPEYGPGMNFLKTIAMTRIEVLQKVEGDIVMTSINLYEGAKLVGTFPLIEHIDKLRERTYPHGTFPEIVK